MKLEIKGVSKNYGHKQAIRGVTQTFEAGVYGVLGENGAGKSTLINILTDNLAPSEGEIWYDGQRIGALGRSYRKKLGYMPQQDSLYEHFTGLAFLNYMASLKEIPRREARRETKELLQKLNLADKANERISSYSGGMRRRLMLAQALLGEPEILILDEPTAGLDPNERIRMRNLIMEISRNKIVMLATHIVSDIECIADYVILFHRGEILRMDTPTGLMESVHSHIYEIPCDKEEIALLQERYPNGTLTQRRGGLVYRTAGDGTVPEGGSVAGEVTLEDVYLWYITCGGN